MYTLEQMIALGYRFGAPSREAEEIDAQVAQRMACSKCGGSMYYVGYHKDTEYVALAVCSKCHHQLAF